MTIGILGGGISGLTLQRFLTHPSEVLEKASRPGGLCRTFWKDGFGFDIGGHILFSKHAHVNELTDIYNFGATMYRLVAWRLPPKTLMEAQSAIPLDAKTWRKLLKPVEQCNREAPPALCELIHRCLAYNPSERPERMSEIQGALDHLADELVLTPEDRLETTE